MQRQNGFENFYDVYRVSYVTKYEVWNIIEQPIM